MTLTPSAFQFCQDRPLFGLSAGDRAIAQADVLWTPGQVITIGFFDGTAEQIDNFKIGLRTWGQFVNLNFQIISNVRDAIVRVIHLPNQSWSEVGRNAINIAKSQPTLSIGWDGMDVILHEIGHLLGLLHEHQNPASNIRWNVQTLNEVLTGPPNFWTARMIERNIIERYSTNQIIGTAFDAASIMLYPIDRSWTVDGFTTPWNMNLSELDIQLVQRLYPFPENVTTTKPIIQEVEDGSTLITNMTDDPENPIILNEANSSFQLNSFGKAAAVAALGYGLNKAFKFLINGN